MTAISVMCFVALSMQGHSTEARASKDAYSFNVCIQVLPGGKASHTPADGHATTQYDSAVLSRSGHHKYPSA